MVVRCLGFTEGSFGGDKAGELEDLPSDESPFVAPVSFLDDAAFFPARQFHAFERDAGFNLHGVDQNFGPDWKCNRTEHAIPRHETRTLGRSALGLNNPLCLVYHSP